MSGCDTIQEWYSYSTAGGVVGKRMHITRGSANGDLSASWTYDNEGRMTGVTYPSWTSGSNSYVGSNYTYAMDTMGRLSTMTDAINSHTLVAGTSYGPASELLSLSGSSWGVDSETRAYNSRLQLTSLNVNSGTLNINYGYSSTNNNGKIAAQTDIVSGEQIVYTYDALNRLATAETSDNPSVTQWGQSYTYDGFGNLLDQTVIKGSAPSLSTTYDYTTNRQTGDIADANGNITQSVTQPQYFRHREPHGGRGRDHGTLRLRSGQQARLARRYLGVARRDRFLERAAGRSWGPTSSPSAARSSSP